MIKQIDLTINFKILSLAIMAKSKTLFPSRKQEEKRLKMKRANEHTRLEKNVKEKGITEAITGIIGLDSISNNNQLYTETNRKQGAPSNHQGTDGSRNKA